MQLDLEQLIKHPQTMDKETLYDLRSLIALYPYFQTARLLMLQNLYILHDPSFDEELRKAAIYITDRKMIFPATDEEEPKKKKRKPTAADAAIDYVSFLLDTESEDEESPEAPLMKGQSLIDDFINNDKGKIELKEEPEYVPESNDTKDSENMVDGSYCTETLARSTYRTGIYPDDWHRAHPGV